MSGVAPDPLDRIAAWAQACPRFRDEIAWVPNDVLTLVEIAHAARAMRLASIAVDNHGVGRAAIEAFDAAFARLDKDTQ